MMIGEIITTGIILYGIASIIIVGLCSKED